MMVGKLYDEDYRCLNVQNNLVSFQSETNDHYIIRIDKISFAVVKKKYIINKKAWVPDANSWYIFINFPIDVITFVNNKYRSNNTIDRLCSNMITKVLLDNKLIINYEKKK